MELWKKNPGGPVLGGRLGTCFDVSLLQNGTELLLYFSWRDKRSIAVCRGTDGLHWSDPVLCLSPDPAREDDVNRPAVCRKDGIYHMWYTSQIQAGRNGGTSVIAHAVSTDGITFTRSGQAPVLVPELPWEKQAVMCPCVLWDEGRKCYRMWYSGGEQFEPDAIGYAESPDGNRWVKSPRNPVFVADPAVPWERHKVTACQVFPYGDEYRMFYIGFFDENRAQIGTARSKDGITGWQRSARNPIVSPTPGGWDADACYKPFVLPVGGRWMLWYNGRRGPVEQIGAAVCDSQELPF